MSDRIKWDLCPEATHYLPKTLQSLGSFWRFYGAVPVTRWDCDGSNPQTANVALSPLGRQSLVARPADWTTAPEEATHHVASIRDRIPTGWYRADGNKMRYLAQEGEYLFRLDDIHTGCDLILEARPATDWSEAPADATHCWNGSRWYKFDIRAETVAIYKWGKWEALDFDDYQGGMSGMEARPKGEPDWSKAPADATHWGPEGGDGRWLEGWYKQAQNGYWLRASWEVSEWIWVDWGMMNDERRAMLIERPAADFSGPVMYFKTPAGMVAELIDAYQRKADRSTYRVDLVDDLNAAIKAGAFDLAAPGGDKTVATHTLAGELIAVWENGLPPAGTRCIVEPHNLQWGFGAHGEHECTVIAYHKDYVWIDLAESVPNVVGPKHLTTRWDKVDFRPLRTPEQIKAKAREDFIRDAVFRTDASVSVDLRIALFGELFDLGYLYPGDEARTAIFDEDKAQAALAASRGDA